MKGYILALDQGTTSSRALLFAPDGTLLSSAQYAFHQYYPKQGWVEHDPMEILSTQYGAMKACVEKAGISPKSIVAIGVTNQRETVVVWEKKTGKPIYPAIVWQCRRTAALCDDLKARGLEETVKEKTGLLIDAYFSGTKLNWILEQVPGARARAEAGELLSGTIDSFLIWNLTGGQSHISDYSNCSRTMLFDIHQLKWDIELCRELSIPMQLLPVPVPNSMEYGRIAKGIPGLEELEGLAICGAAGDQQAALFGQACFRTGQIKNTYGTGCFSLMNTGRHPVESKNGLLSSVAWQVNGETTYVLEGSVFHAGSAIQWLRDELGMIQTASECDTLAESVLDNGGVYMVPAFTGLGAPHWDMYACGTILGLTRGSSRAHVCRAVLEAIAYQTADLVMAMEKDACHSISTLRVDGGASVSNIMMQIQSDLLQIPIERPSMVETTAWGVACLAGLAVGVWPDLFHLEKIRQLDCVFTPQRNRNEAFEVWHAAVKRAMDWEGYHKR
jgi:glycerol kinase